MTRRLFRQSVRFDSLSRAHRLRFAPGGGLADNHTAYRDGRYLRGESFGGDGFRATASLYRTFGWLGPVPLFGVARLQDHYASYYGQKRTDPRVHRPERQ